MFVNYVCLHSFGPEEYIFTCDWRLRYACAMVYSLIPPIRCLSIACEILKALDIKRLSPTLQTLVHTLVGPFAVL